MVQTPHSPESCLRDCGVVQVVLRCFEAVSFGEMKVSSLLLVESQMMLSEITALLIRSRRNYRIRYGSGVFNCLKSYGCQQVASSQLHFSRARAVTIDHEITSTDSDPRPVAPLWHSNSA